MDDKIKYDENGNELPEKYLFGKIPIYRNEYKDTPLWKLALLVAPGMILMVLYREGYLTALW